jgi:hypothetical protein
MIERGSPQMTIQRMRIACWIPKATRTHARTHSEYVILIAFLQQRCTVLRYTYIACLDYANIIQELPKRRRNLNENAVTFVKAYTF